MTSMIKDQHQYRPSRRTRREQQKLRNHYYKNNKNKNKKTTTTTTTTTTTLRSNVHLICNQKPCSLKQCKTPCKWSVYMECRPILDRIFHTTLPHFVTARWALRPYMASAPTSPLEPWITLYMPKKCIQLMKKSAKNHEKSWQFASRHGHNN